MRHDSVKIKSEWYAKSVLVFYWFYYVENIKHRILIQPLSDVAFFRPLTLYLISSFSRFYFHDYHCNCVCMCLCFCILNFVFLSFLCCWMGNQKVFDRLKLFSGRKNYMIFIVEINYDIMNKKHAMSKAFSWCLWATKYWILFYV